MSSRQIIHVEELTAPGFRPFGAVISPLADDHKFADRPSLLSPHSMLELPFEIEGTAALYVIRYPRQEMVATRFERHLTMTETRIALRDAVVFVVGVATPADARPEPGSIRAFLIRPGAGIVLDRGVWHAVSCFPVVGDWTDLVFLSERESEHELERAHPPLARTETYDFASESLVFEIGDISRFLTGPGSVA